jgi:putative phosphoribosyl transferase
MARKFADRTEAGKELADAVAGLGLAHPVVLALPRGGVPVAVPVAQRLGAPLDLLMVRKIGAPGNPELAAGAVVDGPAWEAVFNDDFLRQLGLTKDDFAMAIEQELKVIEARRAKYMGGRAPIDLSGRDAVVVDDGIATGATVRAALKGLRRKAPRSVTLAVPVAPADTLGQIEPLVDHMICLETPAAFRAVGLHYVRFGQVGDAEVIRDLAAANEGDAS